MDVLTVIILFLVIVAIIIANSYEKKTLLAHAAKDKNDLLEEIKSLRASLMSRTSSEYVAIRAMDNVTKQEPEKKNDDVSDMSGLTDEEYDRMIALQNE